MKILAIRGCNLASLEGEFDIDFTTEPLKSAGIFAITGCTGSGKSTILDAVCLALFNNTPRINKVEKGTIQDVKDNTLQLGDSRNILRRGTAFGYAEVDFVSLSGDKYRSRWSVRRAREKVDGKIHVYNIELTNLTANEIQQGSKNELLSKIKELIGLTYDQFTRTVLLAQGDFATFLKAEKKEKADLLEKLTGTDIYSRISTKIYENTQKAKSDLEVVLRNIESVELLSDEQLAEYNSELTEIDIELKNLEQLDKLLSDKIKWIDANNILLKNILSAEKLLIECKTSVEDAKSRFDYIVRVDSVQDIRDDFMSLESTKSQLTKNREILQRQKKLEQVGKEELEKSKEKIERLAKVKSDAESALKTEQPNILKARELDTILVSSTLSLSEVQKEVKSIEKQKENISLNITKSTKELEESRKNVNKLLDWFDENKHISTIIPKSELILSYINDASNAKMQSDSNIRQISSVEKLLTSDNKKLFKWQQEAERLNRLLPTEIALLRTRLVENEPCPVCGSRQHPISSEEVDTLAEEELAKAKEEAATEIKRIENNIKSRESEIISLKSVVESYKEQYLSAYQNIADYLLVLNDWQIMFENGSLTQYITSVVKTWQENERKQTGLTNSIQLKEQELKNYSDRLSETETSLKEKNANLKNKRTEFEGLQSQRKQLFNGESADDVESRLSKYITDTTSEFNTASSNYNALVAKQKEMDGAISQMIATIAEDENKELTLQGSVSEWINNREDNIFFDELKSLLSNESSWIVTERDALNLLINNFTEANATLTERKKNHAEHQDADIKPTEDESKDALSEMIAITVNSLEAKRNRSTTINVAMTNHRNGVARVEKYQKELEQKDSIANNWEKLNVLFGSADGGKFKTIAQGYTLDVHLGYANKHLSEISDRYILERVSSESLSLQVVDLDMLSEVRSVHSLSGGESFLISLALALGLSSLSSNRMRIESLFIDEGFGTLDADTLRIAMDVLERLQTQGRKIGVISHVAEMTERISTQVEVVKMTNGKSSVVIKY